VHLIAALARIGDAEAVPILRHAALYDVNADVRAAAEGVLTRWAAGKDARGDRSRAGLAELSRRRAAGEGPLLYGDGGLPGVPSTVVAPDPIGAGPTPGAPAGQPLRYRAAGRRDIIPEFAGPSAVVGP